ncbi:TorF family putative porin [Hyphomicrobiales bacterium]|nr:TorF family putative porin [Hyphomicrobiales bacterium]
MIFKTIENKAKKFACAIILSVTMSGMALAAVEWNTAVTSEYIWRGMSQGKGAAVSGGIDISGETGFSAGVWVSNVDFGDNTTYELDVYAGYNFGPVSVGYIYYAYPDNTDEGYDFSEVNISADIGSFSLGANILADADWDMDFGDDVYYTLDTSFNAAEGIDISLHLGFYDYDATDEETDYGISIDFESGFSFAVIDSSRDDSDPYFVITYAIGG